MSNLDSIKNKIAALLAKAEGTDNIYEQDAFMAKVNELLERHQIEMHEIRKAGTDSDPLHHIETTITRAHEWPSQVGWALARYYGCKMLRWSIPGTKAQYRIRVVGRQSACVTFDLMLPFVISQVRQQSRAFSRETMLSAAKAERSVGIALSQRIWGMVPQNDERRSDLGGTALVPVDDLDAYIAELFGKPKKARPLNNAIYAGADEYADKVSLTTQVETKGAGRKQIGSK